MPVSHIGLTVSHLPTSTSFFLAALQPLGYRYIGQQGNQIGLGISDADFFLCQETPGVKAGAAHIAFTAPSRTAVRDFYAAALNAGGRPNGAPACRTDDDGHFNAAVLDFDGNSIEVVFGDGPDVRDDGTVVEHSRVITWQRSVVESCRDDRSVVSGRSVQSAAKTLAPAKAPSIISTASKAASMARTVSAPVVPAAQPQVTVESTSTTKVTATGDGACKKIIGTLLGAAAGAAVAYAMVKSEEDSAKKEAKFEAFMHAKEAAGQAKDQLKLTMQEAQPVYESAAKSVYTDEARSVVYGQRQIEAAPVTYQAPSYTSVPPTQIGGQRAIEYIPAASVAPSHVSRASRSSRSEFGPPQRSFTTPELSTVSKARSTVSQSRSVAPSAAPSTLISSFIAEEEIPRRQSEGSIYSTHSTKSKSSRHTSATSKSRSQAPTSAAPSTSSKSKAASIVGSILGRGSSKEADAATVVSTKSKGGKSGSPFSDYYEIEEVDGEDDYDDLDSVAPSDSISNAGSSRSHRSHRSHHSHRSGRSRHHNDDGASSVSKSSKHSSHSRSSHHSKHSHRSSRDDRKSVVSEASDASTVKPAKSRVSTSSRSSRKDSVAGTQYDGLFESVKSGGSVASIPVRGITPSMIADEVPTPKSHNRSLMSFAMGQRLRPFEGAR